MDFNPQKATETLRQYAIDIEAIGEQLETKRLQLIKAQAELYDCEKAARDDLFEGRVEVMASKIRDWLKWRTLEKQYKYDVLKEELRLLIEKKEIITEVCNATKASMRIWELEARHLNLDT